LYHWKLWPYLQSMGYWLWWRTLHPRRS